MPAATTTATRRGLVVGLLLGAAAVLVPLLTGWAVHATADSPRTVAPLHAVWRPTVGAGSPAAVLLGVLGVAYGEAVARRLRWGHLLVVTYAVSLAWALSLALVSGTRGLSRELESPAEYLITARTVHDVPSLLRGFTARIPLGAAPDNWPIHVAGHPPGALLFFVLLVRLGLGSALAAGLAVTVVGTTTPVAVLVTLRRLGVEGAARTAAPFLAVGPAAVWVAVSGDAVFSAVGAWGLAALAAAATTRRTLARWTLAGLAGLLLGLVPLLSYGLVLYAPLALAVVVLTRAWRLVPAVAVAVFVPVLVFAGFGFTWWTAFPVLRRRYWDGLAHSRPAVYWVWADLGSLAISAGPALGAGLGSLAASRRSASPVVRWLVGAAAAAVLLADVSLMSKGEVERIWLPFVPWLLVCVALLPERWRRPMLAVQVAVALLVEHLLNTGW